MKLTNLQESGYTWKVGYLERFRVTRLFTTPWVPISTTLMIPFNPTTLGRGRRRLQGKGALMSLAYFLLIRAVSILGHFDLHHQDITSKQQEQGQQLLHPSRGSCNYRSSQEWTPESQASYTCKIYLQLAKSHRCQIKS